MPEKPHLGVLHRELHIHDVKTYYSRQIEMLEDLVNYGTNLIPACMASSKKHTEDFVVISIFFRQVVSMLDAFDVLFRNACVQASVLQVRAQLEASICMDWILKADTKTRALYYFVANVRRHRLRAVRNTEEGSEEFFQTLNEFGERIKETSNFDIEKAEKVVNESNSLLGKEPYKSINSEFDKIRGNRKYDPAWYCPLNVSSIREMSSLVERLHEYELFYSPMSEYMHTSSYEGHMEFKDKKIDLEPIRQLKKAKLLVNYAAATAIHSYRVLLNTYRPGQLNEFSKRYLRDWHDHFQNIPEIRYD